MPVIRRRFLGRAAREAARAVGYGVAGSGLVLVALFVWVLENRPDLEVWHTAFLEEEFTDGDDVDTFEEYLALEERLFAELEEKVYAQLPDDERRPTNRYSHGSLTEPAAWPRDWNRTFELPREEPRAGVLLLHGMSDSPYSLRVLGANLSERGAYVLGLRIPGHGTAPSGLVHVRYEDMAAAVELAVRHVRDVVGDRPLYLVGYSNGGALAVLYGLAALEDETLPRPSRIVLLSPEIGITKLAALAAWQERLGRLLRLPKLAWNSILPEYDPFKYQSFALNAGKQAYRITQEIQARLRRLEARLGDLPPVLAFQSIADATVSAEALVTGLFDRLPAGEHELVLFDLNRRTGIGDLLASDPRERMEVVVRNAKRTFTLTFVTNVSGDTRAVEARRHTPGGEGPEVVPLGTEWPQGVYSLSHVALPVPPDDPLYGGAAADEHPGIHLGTLAPRGERGVLLVPAADLLRLRWNPFYDVLEARVLAFVGLAP